MAQWLYTAAYDSITVLYNSTGVTEQRNVGNVSEIIIADTEDGARAVARDIAGRYEANGRALRNERLVLSEPIANQVVEQAAPVAQAPAVVERPALRCSRCGTVGLRGPYPFSTLPDSGLCDDCV